MLVLVNVKKRNWQVVAMLDTSMCQKPAARMNFRGIRSSKFRHVYGQPAKKASYYLKF